VSSSPASALVVSFGEFEADLRSRELRRNGSRVRLPDQSFRVLAVLLEHPGELVSREDFQKRLWPSDTFVDFDHGLNNAVNRLRDAMGDSAEFPRIIETLPRRGYRFIGQLHRKVEVGLPETSAQYVSWWRRSAVIVSVIAATSAVLAFSFGSLRGMFSPATHVESVAVLPFENLSHDAEQEYFSDGMTDALITELGKIGGPRVISRQSVMRFKGSQESLQAIAKQLNVDALLEGSVERSGDRVRIRVHLAQAVPERQLWTEEYARPITDVLALQGEIAQSVSREIKVKLTSEGERIAGRSPAPDPEAYSEYLQALYLWNKASTLPEHERAIASYKDAIQKDPNFAPAYAELAISYFWLAHPWLDGPPVRDVLAPAKSAAEKALALDPSLPQAHLAAGLLAETEFKWAEAESQFQTALKLNPNSAEYHDKYAGLLMQLGRTEEAAAETRKEILIDPLSDGYESLPVIAFVARKYDLGITQAESLPESGTIRSGILALLYAEKKDFPRAMAENRECEKRETVQACLMDRAQIYGMAGEQKEVRNIIRQMQKESRKHYVFPMVWMSLYAAAGDKQRALTWLEKAYDEKDPWIGFLKVWPTWDPLRSEPRFQAVMRKANFSS